MPPLGMTFAHAIPIFPLGYVPRRRGHRSITFTRSMLLFEWQEVALPFSPASVRLNQSHRNRADLFERGITTVAGGDHCARTCWEHRASFHHSPKVSLSRPSAAVSLPPPRDQAPVNFEYDPDVELDPGEFFEWHGALFLEPGDYWLKYASAAIGDFMFGQWFTNPDLLHDDFALRSYALSLRTGQGGVFHCDETWASVADYGPAVVGQWESSAGWRLSNSARPRIRLCSIPEPPCGTAICAWRFRACRFTSQKRDLRAKVTRVACDDDIDQPRPSHGLIE